MNTIDVLKNRRSIRSYKKDQIDSNDLQKILEAGTYAPTGMNRQSPVIVVIQDKATIEKLSKINAKIMNSDTDPFYGAPTLIVVFADSNCSTYIEDGSLVIGNLLNAAASLGIGSCWIHRAKETFFTDEGKALMKKWGLGENYIGIGNCILGYADKQYETKPRKDGYIIMADEL